MNKKADLTLTIKVLIGMSLGIAILLFSIAISGPFWNLFFSDITELSKTRLDELETTINGLGVGENDTITAYYINEGFNVIAFNKDKRPRSETGEFYIRPASCFDVACLVICKDSDSENACKSSENIKVFPDIEIFEVTNNITKSIALVKGEYTTLYLERKDDITFIINEINEN